MNACAKPRFFACPPELYVQNLWRAETSNAVPVHRHSCAVLVALCTRNEHPDYFPPDHWKEGQELQDTVNTRSNSMRNSELCRTNSRNSELCRSNSMRNSNSKRSKQVQRLDCLISLNCVYSEEQASSTHGLPDLLEDA